MFSPPLPLDGAAKLIAGFEGFRASPYQDSAGVWTIGYGTVRYPGGKPVEAGDAKVGQPYALELLRFDLVHVSLLLRSALVLRPTAWQWEALLSLGYNVGAETIVRSTLVRELNLGNAVLAAGQFVVWDKVHRDGRLVEVEGLRERRLKERAVFEGVVPLAG